MKKKKTEEVIFFENLMKAAKAVEKKVQKRKEYEEALNNEVLKRIENGEFTSDQLVQIYNINNEAIKKGEADLNAILGPTIHTLITSQQNQNLNQEEVIGGMSKLRDLMTAAQEQMLKEKKNVWER